MKRVDPMSLILCPECHSEVSDQAQSCPKCGYPLALRNSHGQSEQPPSQAPPNPAVSTLPRKRANGLGIAGFVISLCSILFIWSGLLFFAMALLGFILSAAGWARASSRNLGKGLAIAGFVIGLIFCILGSFMPA